MLKAEILPTLNGSILSIIITSHHPDKTETLLKGCKISSHPSRSSAPDKKGIRNNLGVINLISLEPSHRDGSNEGS